MIPVYVAAQIPDMSTWVASRYDGDPWAIAVRIPAALRRAMGRACTKTEAEDVIKTLRIVHTLEELV